MKALNHTIKLLRLNSSCYLFIFGLFLLSILISVSSKLEEPLHFWSSDTNGYNESSEASYWAQIQEEEDFTNYMDVKFIDFLTKEPNQELGVQQILLLLGKIQILSNGDNFVITLVPNTDGMKWRNLIESFLNAQGIPSSRIVVSYRDPVQSPSDHTVKIHLGKA